jgi:hypothetical protein
MGLIPVIAYYAANIYPVLDFDAGHGFTHSSAGLLGYRWADLLYCEPAAECKALLGVLGLS